MPLRNLSPPSGFTEIAKADLPARFPVMEVDIVFFARSVNLDKFAGLNWVSNPSLMNEEKQHD